MEITQEMLDALVPTDLRNYYRTGVYYRTPEEVQFSQTVLNGDDSTFLNGKGIFSKITGNTSGGTIVIISGSTGIVDITYTDLVTLIQTSALIENTSYLITDFQTKHYIVANYTRYFGLGNEITGELEPLIVLATSSNTIDKEAKSIQYPLDIIYYDWNPENWYDDLSFADAEDTKSVIISGYTGTIYFRHDTLLDNYMGYDFRNCKFRRWETLTDAWTGTTEYTPNTFVNYNGYIYKSTSLTGNTDQQPDAYPNYWIQLLNLSLTTYWNNSPYSTNDITSSSVYADFLTFTEAEGAGTATYSLSCTNNHFDSFKETYILRNLNGTILLNTVFFLQDSGLASVSGNHIKSFFANNTIVGYFSNNNIGNYFNSNTIGNGFYTNIIGNDFYTNIIGNDFYSNNIGNNFNTNNIGYGFSSNNIGNNFNTNTIGDSFYNNTIGNSITNNNIGNEFYSNNIGNIFQNNNIGNAFSGNNIGETFLTNTTGIDFQNNNIGLNFAYNNIGDYFRYNTTGNIFNSCSFTGNTIFNNFSSGINNFNNVSLGLIQPSQNYTKNYFSNSSGVVCMSYYDATNSLTIITIDGANFGD